MFSGGWYEAIFYLIFFFRVFVEGESSLPTLPTRLGLSTRREQDIEDLQGRRDAGTQIEISEPKPSSKLDRILLKSDHEKVCKMIHVVSCSLSFTEK